MKTILMSLGALALASTAANARPIVINTQAVPTARVSFADLNLGSAEGRAVLEHRIRATAEDLCVIEGDRALDSRLGGRACYKAAVADGLRQMDEVIGQRVAVGSGR